MSSRKWSDTTSVAESTDAEDTLVESLDTLAELVSALTDAVAELTAALQSVHASTGTSPFVVHSNTQA